jgi:hypothetical protein
MPTALQTPIRREDAAQQVGPKRWRKQILPVGKVPYEGKDLEFSKDYLAKTVKAFNEGAYDQVAFQLADGENKHNLDPEKTRGEVSALELSDDGVYAIFDLSDEGAKLVSENPKLGVSCRIVQDHPKGPAIQHVLGTPRQVRRVGEGLMAEVQAKFGWPGKQISYTCAEAIVGGQVVERRTGTRLVGVAGAGSLVVAGVARWDVPATRATIQGPAGRRRQRAHRRARLRDQGHRLGRDHGRRQKLIAAAAGGLRRRRDPRRTHGHR